jgi:probable phosphoglycerate mutase
VRLLLIRHGQTSSNTLGLLDSRTPGPDLTELGHRQAAAIPGAIKGRPVSSIAVSTMIRTGQTAAPLAAARNVIPVVDEGLREIEAGDLEMASGLDALRRYTDVVWEWAAGNLSPRMPGAQNGFEFFERFDGALDRVLAAGGPDPVIVSHGASLRVWVSHRCTNVSNSFAAEAELHNTGSAIVERGVSGGWELKEWNPLPLGGAALHGKSGPDDMDPTGSLTEDDLH